MRVLTILTFLVCFSTSLYAAEPPGYEADPFDDYALTDESLILDIEFPTAYTGEIGVLFNSSMIDEYSSHLGGLVDFTYFYYPTLAVNIGFGYVHGSLTPIVTDQQGIIGNKVQKCIDDKVGCDDASLKPYVPHYKQITGFANVSAIWAPLYGKLNLVSELDLNLQVYVLLGAGINGTQEQDVQYNDNVPERYTLSTEGGFFNEPKPHFTYGGGIKVFILDWMALRTEIRGIGFFDTFDMTARSYAESDDKNAEAYFAGYYFVNAGLSFTLF
ncbi:MAG: outer membrane beta-barrel domain-containing protein [Myxococcota bacterium]|nr:outer membrane beta-barrel domain-containing protein [Myxococcota bacterium]